MVFHSTTPEIFKERWMDVVLDFDDGQEQRAVDYVFHQWLVHKESIVSAWTDTHMHLGSTVTSRVEGAHSTLKGWLRVSTKDLLGVFGSIEGALATQSVDYEASVSKEKSRIPSRGITKSSNPTQPFRHEFNKPPYGSLPGRISLFALKKIASQRVLVPNSQICAMQFTAVWGLPCTHTIRTREEAGLS